MHAAVHVVGVGRERQRDAYNGGRNRPHGRSLWAVRSRLPVA